MILEQELKKWFCDTILEQDFEEEARFRTLLILKKKNYYEKILTSIIVIISVLKFLTNFLMFFLNESVFWEFGEFKTVPLKEDRKDWHWSTSKLIFFDQLSGTYPSWIKILESNSGACLPRKNHEKQHGKSRTVCRSGKHPTARESQPGAQRGELSKRERTGVRVAGVRGGRVLLEANNDA